MFYHIKKKQQHLKEEKGERKTLKTHANVTNKRPKGRKKTLAYLEGWGGAPKHLARTRMKGTVGMRSGLKENEKKKSLELLRKEGQSGSASVGEKKKMVAGKIQYKSKDSRRGGGGGEKIALLSGRKKKPSPRANDPTIKKPF